MSSTAPAIDDEGVVLSLTRVPVEYVDRYWGDASRLLERAVGQSGGRYNIESIYLEIVRGDSHLWVIFEGEDNVVCAFTTQFIYYPLRMNLSVVFLGSDDSLGNFSGKWVELMPELMEWAKLHGCGAIEIVGRRGWLRVFRDLGFKESYTTIEGEV
tara:strand:- start:90 stop:557 length:468 start_codon:yes stop_codon:yes gene_type:complete